MVTAIAIFGQNFFAAGYSLSDLTTFFLAKDSRIQERIIMQPGTSTGVSIVAGTQADTWVGNPDDLTLPRIELDGSTGEWEFKNRGSGTESQKFLGSNHTHNGSDSTRISHGDLTGTGTNSHTAIDTFIASKGQASGLASLDANSKVVENPASGTSTPGLNKVVMSDGAGKISDAWLSDTITKLGTPTTDAITEGSTNKYYTDDRVNAAIGSTSMSAHNDVNYPSPPSHTQHLIYNAGTGQWEPGSSSATVAWGGITGNPNDQADTQMSQAEAEGGTNTVSKMPSALRMKQAIAQLQGTSTPQLKSMKIGTTTVGNGIEIAGSRLSGQGGIDSYTVLMLHADNPGTSTFTDSEITPKTITANGNAIGSSTAKFGSGSAYFDGTGDYLSLADSADWALSSSFTIDLWARLADTAQSLFVGQRVTSNDMWNFYFSANTLYFQQNVGGSTNINVSSAWSPSINTWYHIAVVNNGGTHTFYVDGAKVGADQYDSTTIADIAAVLQIGETAAISGLNGLLDEVRISKGIARWTGNFTAPAIAYDLYGEKDSISFTDVVGDGGSGMSIIIGSTTTTTARNFELALGQTSLADSWDTRCDPNLKEIINEDGETLAALAYEKTKQLDLKQWKLKEATDHTFLGVMIDDPNIPEEIIWRLDNGQPGGFSGTGFLNYLLAIQQEAIRKQDAQQLEIQQLNAIIGSMTTEIEALKK